MTPTVLMGADVTTTDPLFDDLDLDTLHRRPGGKWQHVAPDVIAAWVADMDFPIPPAVADALAAAARDDLGYPPWLLTGSPLRAAFADRMARRHAWHPAATEVREHTDVLNALQVVLHLATSRGDGVAIQTPSYPPFLATLDEMGRPRVDAPFRRTDTGWEPDVGTLADAVAAHRPKVLLLVNPHNPVGHVYTREELVEIADVARRHDLLVVSDEIHAELVYAPHRHVPFASIGSDAAARTVTLTSASKSFNLAGLRCAVAHYGPQRLLAAVDAQPGDLHGAVSVLGVVGTLAAWRDGDDWQRRLQQVLERNRQRVAAAVAGWSATLPADPPPQATYLYWFDAARLGADCDDPVADVLARARVRLDGGVPFGPGAGHRLRLNFATGAAVLDEMLARLGKLAAG